VREQSATRQQLEASIRALLPSQADIDELTPSKNSAASIAGVGGIMTATSGPLPRPAGPQRRES